MVLLILKESISAAFIAQICLGLDARVHQHFQHVVCLKQMGSHQLSMLRSS